LDRVVRFLARSGEVSARFADHERAELDDVLVHEVETRGMPRSDRRTKKKNGVWSARIRDALLDCARPGSRRMTP